MRAYERHFGFQEPPFSVTPDPRFFYANPAYREAYSTLRYGVEARKGFILVTGEAGTGKTTLLRMLMQHADSGIQTAFIFNPPSTFLELLQAILSELELPQIAEDKARMTAQFNDYLLDQFKQGHIVSLLIDEAQTLSHEMLEQLRLLSNLEARNAKLVQIVLMGQPELEEKLDRSELRQLKQRMALRCRIEPLSPEDVAQYIDFRLAVAGYAGEELFNRAGINRIALYSQGIPRLINVLCDNALLRTCRAGASKVSIAMINEVAHDLRLDVMPAAGPAPAYNRQKSFFNDSSAESAKPLQPRGLARLVRKRMDWPTVHFGICFIAITVAATGLIKYFEHNGLRLARTANPVEEASIASRGNSAQMEGEIVVGPRAGSQDDGAAGTEAPSVRTRGATAGNFERAAAAREALPAQRNVAATANGGPVKLSPNDSKEESAETSRSRAVVKLDQDKTMRIAGRATQPRSLGVFNVVGTSLIRDKPAADAEITGSFDPGTQVRVVSKTGDYLRVQSLDAPTLRGYVHVEDAFFEPAS